MVSVVLYAYILAKLEGIKKLLPQRLVSKMLSHNLICVTFTFHLNGKSERSSLSANPTHCDLFTGANRTQCDLFTGSYQCNF